MDMENLIEKISKVGQEKQNVAMALEEAKRNDFIGKLNVVKNLQPRLVKMWKTAQALLDNGFQLGMTKLDNCGFSHYDLETDGIFHGLGFKVKRGWCDTCGIVIGFGIEGGGWDGYDFTVDTDGNPQQDMKSRFFHNEGRSLDYAWNVPSICGKVEKFIKMFDEYEQRFYQYVETVIAE